MLVIWKSGATETIDHWQEKVNYSEALKRYAAVRPFLPDSNCRTLSDSS